MVKPEQVELLNHRKGKRRKQKMVTNFDTTYIKIYSIAEETVFH